MSLVYIFTGEGKGKTSAALGMALRARCSDLKVAWIAWYKDPSWLVSEYKMNKLIGVDLFVGGKGFFFTSGEKVKKTKVGAVVDKADESEHRAAASKSLKLASDLIHSQKYDLVVLDEICQAAGDKLIELNPVLDLITSRGRTHLVMTGRHCPQAMVEAADTVTEMRSLKHAYDKGIGAVKGLDF